VSTLTRLLLVFTSLLLGPLVATADDLPEDADKITSLTVEEAKRLVAQHNAEFKGKYLSLSGLTTLDAATAKALAGFKGEGLYLNRLTTLDAATAKALAELKGLGLDGLTSLDAATAKALAEFKGQRLNLLGLQRASFGAVRALRQNPRIYMLNHWYLLRYQIAALVGTVVFVVMAGVVVWYSRRQRTAG
jgi:hypothetical protein